MLCKIKLNEEDFVFLFWTTVWFIGRYLDSLLGHWMLFIILPSGLLLAMVTAIIAAAYMETLDVLCSPYEII